MGNEITLSVVDLILKFDTAAEYPYIYIGPKKNGTCSIATLALSCLETHESLSLWRFQTKVFRFCCRTGVVPPLKPV
jgi:hypothetical protein